MAENGVYDPNAARRLYRLLKKTYHGRRLVEMSKQQPIKAVR